jgi:N-acetylneuraminic acid mutarotase
MEEVLMKKFIIVAVALFYSFIGINMVFAAADTWTQKADFGGDARQFAIGFSIGSKGYIGVGADQSSGKQDFWEYDPATNIWTQKADFGGGGRLYTVGFSIGSKGYIGTGNNNVTKDFWEYDPVTNIWTRKADFGGDERFGAISFSIGSKGYIGLGSALSSAGNWYHAKDFWEYDPATDSWVQRADFAGPSSAVDIGLSIGNKGYIGIGGNTAEFWEYDPSIDTWTRKNDFGGTPRGRPIRFSIGTKGYIGLGFNNETDFWEYDQATDTWTRKADFSGIGRDGAVGLSIGNKGYVGTGCGNGSNIYYKDFWEYKPAATSITMTFEGLKNGEVVGDYYNGGYSYDYNTGLPSSGPGPNYGVTFLPQGNIGVGENISRETTGIWRGEPTPHTAIGFQQGGAWMNVESGFTGSLSFYYGNPNNASKIYIYDGLNRTGNLLATLDLPRTIQDTDGAFLMVYASVSFTGTARSVDFSEEANSCVMDDITLGTPVPPVADMTPDQFIFNYVTGVALNTVITSNTITVSGINVAVPISITGGKYSINGGSYTNASGTVNNGDKVTVQQTSSGSYSTTTVATLTIGGISDTFSVTTKVESIISLNPVANKTILWPPNNRMVAVTIQANTTDSSGGPVKLTAAVSCNQPTRSGGDWTQPIINQKTGIISLTLRATRSGNRSDRIYTITITATGMAGNLSTKTISVIVPHDMRRIKMR